MELIAFGCYLLSFFVAPGTAIMLFYFWLKCFSTRYRSAFLKTLASFVTWLAVSYMYYKNIPKGNELATWNFGGYWLLFHTGYPILGVALAAYSNSVIRRMVTVDVLPSPESARSEKNGT